VVGVEGLDVAELQAGRARRAHVLPGGSAVRGAHDDAVGRRVAAHPGGTGADRGEATEVRGGAGRSVVPRIPGPGCSRGRGSEEERETGQQDDSLHRVAEPIILSPMTITTVMVRVRAARTSSARPSASISA